VELAAGADHESAGNDCKLVVEHDRTAAAREEGYLTLMGKLHPLGCTNKNDMLVGVPAQSGLAAGSELITSLLEQAVASTCDSVPEFTVAAFAISSNAERPKTMTSKTKEINAAAPSKTEGIETARRRCSFFNTRRQRQCRNFLEDGDGDVFCVEHQRLKHAQDAGANGNL